jgi:hypothetical protein
MEMSSQVAMDRRDTEPADEEGERNCKQLLRRKSIQPIDQKLKHFEPIAHAMHSRQRPSPTVATRGLSEAFASVLSRANGGGRAGREAVAGTPPFGRIATPSVGPSSAALARSAGASLDNTHLSKSRRIATQAKKGGQNTVVEGRSRRLIDEAQLQSTIPIDPGL